MSDKYKLTEEDKTLADLDAAHQEIAELTARAEAAEAKAKEAEEVASVDRGGCDRALASLDVAARTCRALAETIEAMTAERDAAVQRAEKAERDLSLMVEAAMPVAAAPDSCVNQDPQSRESRKAITAIHDAAQRRCHSMGNTWCGCCGEKVPVKDTFPGRVLGCGPWCSRCREWRSMFVEAPCPHDGTKPGKLRRLPDAKTSETVGEPSVRAPAVAVANAAPASAPKSGEGVEADDEVLCDRCGRCPGVSSDGSTPYCHFCLHECTFTRAELLRHGLPVDEPTHRDPVVRAAYRANIERRGRAAEREEIVARLERLAEGLSGNPWHEGVVRAIGTIQQRGAAGAKGGERATPSPTCEWCEWDDDPDGGHIGVGPKCGKPAMWLSCMPLVKTPTCDEHKCRCAKPPAPPQDAGAKGGG